MEAARVIRGGVTIPAKVRRRLGLEEGTLVGLEITETSVIIRRARIIADDEAAGDASGNGRKLVTEGA